ncbi:MAG TPA: ABC transporter permease [Gemmatimonadales bacterium]|jgi:predicted permease
MIDGMLADLRYAARMLRRTPGFTIVAVLTLALGIGANTTVFSLLNAALFRRMDVPEPGRLVWLIGIGDHGRTRGVSFPEYREHRADGVFTGLLAYSHVSLALGSGGEPERIEGSIVTGNYFSTLEVPMKLGRGFAADEDGARNANPAIVLSDGLWRRRFAADSGIVGRGVVVNGAPFTVVGVTPANFRGLELDESGEAWVTMSQLARVMPRDSSILEERRAQWIRVIGRLKDGITLAEARARVAAGAARVAQLWQDTHAETGATVETLAGGLDPQSRREGTPILLLLMSVPALVLLIACANAANLLLSRATTRRREIAVRLALGATRARLVRMLALESMLLGLMAGGLAMLCALWLTGLVSALGNIPAAVVNSVRPDGRVLAFTMTLGLLTGFVFGLVPALGATRPGVAPTLKEDGSGGGRLGGSRLIKSLVVAQVAVSLVLLVVAGLFLRTLAKASNVSTGFETHSSVTVSFDLATVGYDDARRERFYEDLLERVRGLPGVQQASLASDLPLSNRMVGSDVQREGQVQQPGAQASPEQERDFGTGLASIYPGYFRVMGIPLVAGRDFTTNDAAATTKVTIINQELARRLWPSQSPLGKRLRLGPDEPLLEVVGVTANGKYHELTEDPQGFLYVPSRQQTFATDITLVARTANPAGLLPVLREVLREMDHNLPLYDLGTMTEHVLRRLDKEQGVSALTGSFGALALLLASLGLYGVMSYGVAQRTRELGIRVALGAARREVLRMVLAEGVRLAGIGVVVGLVLAAALTRIIAKYLYGVTPTDLTTFAAVAAMLLLVAGLATLIPARRATAVDPMIALRAE